MYCVIVLSKGGDGIFEFSDDGILWVPENLLCIKFKINFLSHATFSKLNDSLKTSQTDLNLSDKMILVRKRSEEYFLGWSSEGPELGLNTL